MNAIDRSGLREPSSMVSPFMNPIRYDQGSPSQMPSNVCKNHRTPECNRGCSHEGFGTASCSFVVHVGFFVLVEVFLQGESCECGHTHHAHTGHLGGRRGQTFRGGRGKNGCGDGRRRGKVRARGAIVDVLADVGCEGSQICNGNRSAGRSKSLGKCVACLRSIEVEMEMEMTYCSSLLRCTSL